MKSLLFAVGISFIVAACGGEGGNLVRDGEQEAPNNPVTVATAVPAPTDSSDPLTPDSSDPLSPTSTPTGEPSDPTVAFEVPSIEMLTFVKVTEPDLRLVDAKEVTTGTVIDRSVFKEQLVNLVAMSKDESKTGSVHFDLKGPSTINRLENAAPYTLANQALNINLSKGELASGNYTLQVTPYEKPDGEGAAGTTTTVVFSVVDNQSTDPSAPIEENTVPNISLVKLVRFDENANGYVDVMRLENDSVIDLGRYPSDLLNIVADSENASKTGSVNFDLVGPVNLNRHENSAIYTLQTESTNFSVGDGQLSVGDYSLSVTPYQEPNLKGKKGIEFNVTFSIIRSEGDPLPVPTAAPAAPSNSVVANDDIYTVESDKVFEADVTRGVASNDIFSTNNPIFSIIQSSKSGVINMDLDGSFTYTPNNGFSGQDAFTYELNANGKKVQATANIRVYNQNDGGGFTVFKPSSDSRIIYVSNSGNDNNKCLSESDPCKTISEGIEKMREGFPDHLRLKRGDVWTVGNRALDGIPSGRSKQEPTVFSYYGDASDGGRPVIQAETQVYRQDKKDVKHVRWVGLHFYAFKKDPLNPQYNPSAGGASLRFIGSFKDIHIEDCKFEFAGMTIEQNTGIKKRPADFRLKRNIMYGAYTNKSSYSHDGRATLLYTYGVDGLSVEDNLFDTGGWSPFVKGAGANMFSHNIYMQWDSDGNKTSFVNNISTRSASHGIQMRSGGLAKDNFFARNAIGILIGYNFGAREIPKGTIAHSINNVISEGASMHRGIENCSSNKVCTGALWGLHMTVNSGADYQAHGNIISKILNPADLSNPKDIHTHSNARITTRVLETPTISGSTVKSGWFLFSKGLHEGGGRSTYPKSGNIIYRWDNSDQGVKNDYLEPERTLATYNEKLTGVKSFDAFIQTALNRPLGTWDSKYEARSINNYIREGFKKK